MGNTALQLATSHGYSSAHLDTVNCILDFCSAQPLAASGRASLVSCVLESRDNGGNTALLSAAQWGNARLVRAMLQHGANPFSLRQASDHSSALHWAMRRGDARMAWALLRAGGWPLLLLRPGGGAAPPSDPQDCPPRCPYSSPVEHGADHSTATSCWGGSLGGGASAPAPRLAAAMLVSGGTIVCSDSNTSSISSDSYDCTPHAPPNSPVAGDSQREAERLWAPGAGAGDGHETDTAAYGCTALAAADGAGFVPLAHAVRQWGRAALLATAKGVAQSPSCPAGQAVGREHDRPAHASLALSFTDALCLLGLLPAEIAGGVAATLI